MAMAVKTGGDAGGRRGRRRRGGGMMSEINMTPFIDVVLVLLIIFMVAAPLMTNSVPIDLPDAKGKPAEGMVKPIVVSVDATGKIFVGETEIKKIEDLVPLLQAMVKAGADERIVFQGDKAAVWGTAAKVMAELTNAGFKKIAIQMNPS